MNKQLSISVWYLMTAACLVVGLVGGARQAAAQTVAPGPFFPTPAWDQKLQCDTSASCPRFIVLSNWNSEAVLDRETGLVWEQSPSGAAFSWSAAIDHCDITKGDRIGWRLPTLQELASLLDRTVPFPGPTLPPGHPFSNVRSAFYWSATTNATPFTSLAWGVSFGFGDAVVIDDKSLPHALWCVRGGQGVDGAFKAFR